MQDIHEVEDQGEHIRMGTRPIESGNAVPFLKRGPAQVVEPMTAGNSLALNLQLYDQVQSMNSMSPMAGRGYDGMENPEGSPGMLSG